MGKRRTLLAGGLATLSLIGASGHAAAQKAISLAEVRGRDGALREGAANAGGDMLLPELPVRRGGGWEVLP